MSNVESAQDKQNKATNSNGGESATAENEANDGEVDQEEGSDSCSNHQNEAANEKDQERDRSRRQEDRNG